MAANWISEGAGFHVAECALGAGVVVHLLVEGLGDHGWRWQMWDPSRSLRARRGVVDTLEAAKRRAELAVVEAVVHAEMVLVGVFGRLREAA